MTSGPVSEGPSPVSDSPKIFYLPQLSLTGAREDRWRQLCAEAAVERDPEKLQALVKEILRLFDPWSKFTNRDQLLPGEHT